jgi:hypothetical protein
MKNIRFLLFWLTAMALSTGAFAQTLMPLPPHSSVYTSTVRGYWFVAPTNFNIVGLRVCIDAGTTDQYIHVMRINDPTPVVYPTSSTNFTTLAYISAATNNVIQTVNIPVTAGDIIGIMGAVGTNTSNSYSGSVTPYATTIGGFPVNLSRLLYQGAITSGPAPNYSTEGSPYPISRVEMWYITGPPCPVPTSLNATAITSTSATVGWTAVAGSTGYDYVVDQNAGNPSTAGTSTTGTSAPVTGLTTSTNYYLHVRNKCSSTSLSVWVHYPFTTLPPCKPPIGFHTTNLMPTYTDINWAVWPSALTYDYVVDQNRANPGSSTGVINTAATTAPIPALTENTWYYVHLRSRCAGNEVSDWGLDSFITPIVCRAPEIKIDYINTDEAVAYWAAIPTAYEYEYAITTSATPPVLGTKYMYTSIHTSALNDGVDYYVHVRSNCESVGSKSSSPWATASFKTFPTGINNNRGEDFGLACFPNPVTSVMRLTLKGKINGEPVITISDVSGRVLKTIVMTSRELEVNMEAYAKGMYIIKYTDSERNGTIHISKQ